MQKDKRMIKNAWVNQIQQKQGEDCIDIYYKSMTKIAILLLNDVSEQVQFNKICLKGKHLAQQVVDHPARHYYELYRYGYLTFEKLCQHLNDLNNDELYYFFVRLIYPSFYYENEMTIDLFTYQTQLSSVMAYLKSRIDLPVIIY